MTDEKCPQCGVEIGGLLERDLGHMVGGLECLRRQVAQFKARLETPIVCLCGSTRFMEAFFAAGWELTLLGQIILSVGVCTHVGPEGHGGEALGEEVVERLDELHLRKIDLADWVLVLNVGNYIGDSTRAELEYARKAGKPCHHLFPGGTCPTPPDPSDYPSWETIAAATRAAATRAAAKAVKENKAKRQE